MVELLLNKIPEYTYIIQTSMPFENHFSQFHAFTLTELTETDFRHITDLVFRCLYTTSPIICKKQSALSETPYGVTESALNLSQIDFAVQ